MHENRDRLVEDLSERLRTALKSGDPTELLDATTLFLARDLAQALPEDSRDAAVADVIEALSVLVAVHLARYQFLPEGEDQEDLQACLKWSAMLLPVAPELVPGPVRAYLDGPGSPTDGAAAEHHRRGATLYTDYMQSGDIQLLETAISLFREAVGTTPTGDPHRAGCLSNLGGALQTRFEHTRQLTDLDEAIAVGREAVGAAPARHPDRLGMLSNLGNALRIRFEGTGQLADLDQAIAVGREAVGAAPAGHPDRPGLLSNLGAALGRRFEGTGQLADLDQAIAVGREAVGAAPARHPDRPGLLSNFGNALQRRYQRTGQLADLDEAIAVGREAVGAAPAGHPDRLGMLSNLGNALRIRFEGTGQLADLDEAIAIGREAVGATLAGHLARLGMLSNLGVALQRRFERTGQLADMDESITLFRDAIGSTRAGRPERPLYLSNLGNALRSRFERTGQLADMDESITLFRDAIGSTPAGHPERPLMLSNLGNALQSRFDHAGQLADLDEGIILYRESVAATRAGQPELFRYLSNLGGALQSRFKRTGQLADLDEAIAVGREAVSATPNGHPDRPGMLSNLGSVLQIRFRRTGQEADLHQGVMLFREAVEATPLGEPVRAVMLSNLGRALATRFGHTGEHVDLDKAITIFREAVDVIPADHPDRVVYLSNVGAALRLRFERTERRADLDQALEVFREGAEVLTASPTERLVAARWWGQCAIMAGIPESAIEGYTAAIELLPLVAWHGLDQPTREHHLGEWAGLASDAAAAAVAAGDPLRAVELLEAGRSMLWTQALHLRQDLATLQDRAPDLAAALEASRAVLDTSSTSLIRDLDTAEDTDRRRAAEQGMLEERRRAARDWDAAVAQIRQIEGFEHFLRPVPFTDLRTVASGGPVVIVNVSRHGSHALVLTPAAGPDSGPAVLVADLPAAPMGTVIDQANTLLATLARAGAPDTEWQAREDGRHAVFGVLEWCWEAITEPVLAALGHTRTPQGRIEEWPRVWWCPTGQATVLPLHAAGRHPRTAHQHQAMGEAAAVAECVAGRVISSYTPTLAALIRARARPIPGRVRLLAVGVPDAPGYVPGVSPLPAVPAELQVLASYLPPPEDATQLLGAAATRQAVLDALPGYSWLHLSCHGFQHPDDASLSAFLLDDQRLTLADLAALDLRETDLAYLSACQTAAGDLELLDEARHLAAALQLTGYRHVLATLWSISDAAAPAMADTTYAHLLHPNPGHPNSVGQPEAARASYALHHAVTRLRRALPGEPLLWAPYIHLGP